MIVIPQGRVRGLPTASRRQLGDERDVSQGGDSGAGTNKTLRTSQRYAGDIH